MGKTLFRYFFTRYLIAAAYFMSGIMALIFVTNFTELNSRLSGYKNYTASIGLEISGLQVLSVLQQTIPFIGLFASMAMLVQLNRKYELVIARSAGLSAWQFLLPICFGAFTFGLFTILVINPIAATMLAKAEETQSGLGAGVSPQSPALSTPWIRQSEPDGDVIIGAKSVLGNGRTLISPVFFILGKDDEIKHRIDAQRAELSDRSWHLANAVTSSPGSLPQPAATMIFSTNLTPELIQERLQNPEMIPFLELPQKIAVAKALGYQANVFEMQFQNILALPALMVVMTFIASTVTLKFVRFGQSATMIVSGILAGFMLYVVTVLVKAFGGAGIVPPVIAAWFPVGLAFLFGVSFLLNKEDG